MRVIAILSSVIVLYAFFSMDWVTMPYSNALPRELSEIARALDSDPSMTGIEVFDNRDTFAVLERTRLPYSPTEQEASLLIVIPIAAILNALVALTNQHFSRAIAAQVFVTSGAAFLITLNFSGQIHEDMVADGIQVTVIINLLLAMLSFIATIVGSRNKTVQSPSQQVPIGPIAPPPEDVAQLLQFLYSPETLSKRPGESQHVTVHRDQFQELVQGAKRAGWILAQTKEIPPHFVYCIFA